MMKKWEKVEEKDIVNILKAHTAVIKTALSTKQQQDVDNLTDYLLNDADIYV